eukprot:g7043.t1
MGDADQRTGAKPRKSLIFGDATFGDEKLYEWDMVMLFPVRSGRDRNRRQFINSMLGLRKGVVTDGRGQPKTIEFVDEAHRFLHTDRCFMNFD